MRDSEVNEEYLAELFDESARFETPAFICFTF